MNSEDHGDVASLDTVNGEVSDLEWVAGELLILDDEAFGGWESEDGNEEERKACDEGVNGLHGGCCSVVVCWVVYEVKNASMKTRRVG